MSVLVLTPACASVDPRLCLICLCLCWPLAVSQMYVLVLIVGCVSHVCACVGPLAVFHMFMFVLTTGYFSQVFALIDPLAVSKLYVL